MHNEKNKINTPNNSSELNDNNNLKNNFNKSLLDSYSNLSPINLVNFIENNYNLFLSKSNIESLSILKNYKSKIKNYLIEFKKDKYSDFLNKLSNNEKVTVFKYINSSLYIGDNKGYVKLYKDETFKNKFYKFNCSVNSLDVSIDNNYLLTGYDNGSIILWDINKNKIIFEKKYNYSIINLKFIEKFKEKNFYFLFSDKGNSVYEIELKNNNYKENLLYKQKFSVNNIIIYYIKNDIILIGFVQENSIKIYLYKSSIKHILNIEETIEFNYNNINNYNHNNIITTTKNYLPNLSFGLGYFPYNVHIDENNIKDDILIAASFKKIIKFYILTFDNKFTHYYILNEGNPTFHFINDYNIIKIGFICSSILFIYDENIQFKLIHTKYCNIGDYKSNNKLQTTVKAIIKDNNFNLEKLLTYNISKTKDFILDSNLIINENNIIYILYENTLYKSHIKNIEYILNYIKENGLWIDVLKLGIEIYKGNIDYLPYSPLNKEDKLNFVIYLKRLLFEYIDNIFKIYNDDSKNSENQIDECMNVSIEFCILIEDIKFLLNDIQNTFLYKGKSDVFIKKIEPFIINNKLNNYNISDNISDLYVTYKTKKELCLFSHLLVHLKYESLNNIFIKRFSINENLFTSLIYIFCNGISYIDFFLPIVKMFKAFNNMESKNNISNYIEMYRENGIEYVEGSKEFIGHKLLWYIELCLKGKKFCLNKNNDSKFFIYDFESENYKIFICLIYLFLLDKENFFIFNKFDSYSFFNILIKFFVESHLIKIIKSFNFNELVIKKVYNKIYENNYYYLEKKTKNEKNIPINLNEKINYNNQKEVVTYIINLTNNISNFFINHNLNLFIIKAITKDEKLIEKEIVIKSYTQILTFYDNYESEKKRIEFNDRFNCYGNLTDKNHPYFNELYSNLYNLINSQKNIFSNEDLSNLIKSSFNSSFYLIRIKIFELLKKYPECLNEFIRHHEKLEENKIFNWINSTFKYLSNLKLKDEIKNLQNKILDVFPKLVEINKLQANKIIENKIFEMDQLILIVEKFDKKPDLQLYFINKILFEILIEEYKLNYSNDEIIEEKGKKILNNIQKLFYIYINLFIKLNRHKEIKQILIENENYYVIKDILNLCINNNIIDCIVFLYEKMGLYKYAFDEAKKYLLNNIKNLENNYDNKNIIKEYKNSLELCINVCENNTNSKINKKDFDDDLEGFWFELFDILYENNKDKLTDIITYDIDNLLKKICSFLSIKDFIFYINNNEKYEGIKMKEIKNIFKSFNKSYHNFSNVLESFKTVVSDSIDINNKTLSKESNKGIIFKIDKCDYCSKKLNNTTKDSFITFMCGHKVHYKCIGGNKMNPYCITCKRNEFNSLLLIEKKRNSFNLLQNSNERIGQNQENEENKKKIKLKFDLYKLKNLDKRYFEINETMLSIEK